MENEIRTYTVIPKGAGMVALAICDAPAVECDFQTFSKDAPLVKFSVNSEEKRIVTGCLIRTDYKILRQFPSGELYYVVFTKEVAKELLQNFLKNGYQNEVNLDHTAVFPEGIEPLEFYIKDIDRGINPAGFEDCADGSVFCTYHVSNDDVWSAIKEGTFKGFSLEAYLDIERTDNYAWVDAILEIVNN